MKYPLFTEPWDQYTFSGTHPASGIIYDFNNTLAFTPPVSSWAIGARVSYSLNGLCGEGQIVQDFLNGTYLIDIVSCNHWTRLPDSQIIMPVSSLTYKIGQNW